MTQQATLPTIDTSAGPRVRIRADAPWMPESVRERIRDEGAVGHRSGFSKAERRILRKRPRIPVSQWAERHRWVRVSSRAGQWSNAVTPYLVGIMDAMGHPAVRDGTICAAPQTGKTEAVYNCLGYWIDRDPGPALVVFADEQTARDEHDERIRPMIEDSPRLRQYRTAAARDTTTLKASLQHMVLHLAWATSVARLATKPKRYVIFDEVDKYPEGFKRETDPIRLGSLRTRSYAEERRIVKLSTPTWQQGPVWVSLQQAQAVFHYHVRCPSCRMLQRMHFGERDSQGGIKWPGDQRDPNIIEAERLAWYECPHCGAAWDDAARDRAVRLGEWREANTGRELTRELQASRPARIGFHLPAWLSSFVSLSECAASFLRGQESKSALRDFMNSICAEPWVEYEAERSEDQVLALCDERPRGQVPQGADVLLAGIDTQDNGFWYEIRAFAAGPLLESWQVREGFVAADWSKVDPAELSGRSWPYHPAFDALRRILWEDEYLDAAGNVHQVRFAGIDAMGHLTSQVYDFCRAHRGRIAPLQGKPYRQNTPRKWSKIDTYPGSNKPIPGGVQLLQLDVNLYKDELSGKLQVAAMDPGAWHLHSETSKDWARQLCSEYLDEKTGRWACPDGVANHAWDCSVYVLALAEELGVRHMARSGEENQQRKSAGSKRGRENPYTGGRNPFAG